jgi:hypothetical protein
MPSLKGIGATTAVGILLGILLVVWIEPTTTGGMGLIIAVAVLATTALAALGKLMRSRK